MTTEELLCQRLARQHLTAPIDAETVCHDLIALQAQYWRNAVHALRGRIAGRWKRTGRKLELTSFEWMSSHEQALVETAAQALFGALQVKWETL